MLDRFGAWVTRLWAWCVERAHKMWGEASTWWGILLAAVAQIAPQYAQFDQRIAWAGTLAGVYLMAKKGTPSGGPAS